MELHLKPFLFFKKLHHHFPLKNDVIFWKKNRNVFRLIAVTPSRKRKSFLHTSPRPSVPGASHFPEIQNLKKEYARHILKVGSCLYVNQYILSPKPLLSDA
jgi:hypothetical protein